MGIKSFFKEVLRGSGWDTQLFGEQNNQSLDQRIAEAAPKRWTKEEFNEWLDTLEEPIRQAILLKCKEFVAQGHDYMEALHQIRRKIDADAAKMDGIKKGTKHTKVAAAQAAPKRSLFATISSLMWEWDEAMKMGEERRFYQEQHERWQKEKKEKGW